MCFVRDFGFQERIKKKNFEFEVGVEFYWIRADHFLLMV